MEFDKKLYEKQLIGFLKNPSSVNRFKNLLKKGFNLSKPQSYGALKKFFKKSSLSGDVHLFGSRMMALGSRKSDLDVFVSIGEWKLLNC